ncbi:MAG TPA: lipocalin family protein [Saprospiraceae bacterium]|nr:lipocalin family protein [Saprospiraceae bacterium]HMQ85328.1 lipocalin family protein [Saprospiraceae bacterium]
MKFIPFFLTLIGLCLSLTLSAQKSALVGDWEMAVPTQDGSMMTIKVSLKGDGTYSVDFGNDGTNEINGAYTTDGDKITIKDADGPQACPGEGIYTYTATETSLTMTRVSDACEGRGGPEGVMAMKRM